MNAELNFEVNRIADPILKEINERVGHFNSEDGVIKLSNFARKQWDTEKSKELLPPKFRNIDQFPLWYTDYLIQQLLILGNPHKSEKIIDRDLDFFQSKRALVGDALLGNKIDFNNKEEQKKVPYSVRRIKNHQIPYQMDHIGLKGHRMIYILENYSENYDIYKKRFKKITGVEIEQFYGLSQFLFEILTSCNHPHSFITDDLYKAESIIIPEDEYKLILSRLSCDNKQFKTQYMELANEYFRRLGNGKIEIGKEIFYSTHETIPSYFKKKPLYEYRQADRRSYLCPSPMGFRLYLNDCIISILRENETEEEKKSKDCFNNWWGNAFEKYCKALPENSSSNYIKIEEYEYIKGTTKKGPSDMTLIVDNFAFLFECKTFSYPILSTATGREAPNEWEWKEILRRLNKVIGQQYTHIFNLKNKKNIIYKHPQLANVKALFPIIVTFENIYDINTTYFHHNHDCLETFLDDLDSFDKNNWRKTFETNNINHNTFDFLVISVREYEFLIELLNKDKKVFMECIVDMFNRWNYFRCPKETESIEFVLRHYEQAKLSPSGIAPHRKIQDFFNQWYKEKVLPTILKPELHESMLKNAENSTIASKYNQKSLRRVHPKDSIRSDKFGSLYR